MSDYYCRLKELWEQIAELEDILECSCRAMEKCSSEIVEKMAQREYDDNIMMKFLNCLNDGYEHMRTNFLRMEALIVIQQGV